MGGDFDAVDMPLIEETDEDYVDLRKHRPPCLPEDRWKNLLLFLEEVDKVQQETKLLESYVEDIKIKHSQILTTPRADDRLNTELNKIMEAFTQLSKKLKNSVRDMNLETDNLESRCRQQWKQNHDDQYLMDVRIRKTHYRSLSFRLQTVVHNYFSEQSRYRERCKDKIQGYLRITGHSMSNDDIDEAIESGDLNNLAAGILMDTQRAKQALRDVEARNEDIKRLEMSVTEVAQLFRDLADIVYNQGEMVDRIENHVLKSAGYMHKGKESVSKAQRFRDKYRKKKICLGVCIALVLIILIIAIALYLHYDGD